VAEIGVAVQVPVVIVPILLNDESVFTAVLTNVPLRGNVIFVGPSVVNVSDEPPEVIRLPDNVMVLRLELEMPVPPLLGANIPVV
jgi:hypothetical protein